MFNIQSINDIITNSSSEVIMQVENLQNFKKFIDEILKIAGSDFKCDDLFVITKDIPDKWAYEDDYVKWLKDEHNIEIEDDNINIEEYTKNFEYTKSLDYFIINVYHDSYYYRPVGSEIIIKPINDVSNDTLTYLINNVFGAEAYVDY